MTEHARPYGVPSRARKLSEKLTLISFVSFLAVVTLAWASFLVWVLWAGMFWLLA